jgi:hypothetical protein
MIYEYKLVDGRVPDCLQDGGYWYDGNTMVGIILDSWQYDIPTRFRQIGLTELIDRAVTLGATDPITREPLTTEQVTSQVMVWAGDRNEQATPELDKDYLLSRLTVTYNGAVYNAGELARGRMAQAILVLDPLESTAWLDVNNSPVVMTRESLIALLRVAGEAAQQIIIGV